MISPRPDGGGPGRGRRGAALFAAVLLAGCDAVPETAASAAQCYIPPDLAAAAAPTPPDARPDAPATGHLLAMSWSPEFCRFRAEDPAHAGQCQDNSFGFILHGLWPQAGSGPHPRACASARPVPEPVLRAHYCMMPSADLMQHEWAAHGSCEWTEPAGYFADAAALWDRYRRPKLYWLSHRPDLTAGDVRAAFVRANEGLPASAVAIEINERGWLEEVRLCLDLAYAPRPCRAGEFGPSADTPLTIWRGNL